LKKILLPTLLLLSNAMDEDGPPPMEGDVTIWGNPDGGCPDGEASPTMANVNFKTKSKPWQLLLSNKLLK
jgi:hypothetical protein